MNKKHLEKSSQTDWKRVDALADEDIDLSESPELGSDFFKRAKLVMPEPKERITIRLDKEVLAYFRSLGPGYQSRINALLKGFVREQKTGGA